jgi:hypothetical protein
MGTTRKEVEAIVVAGLGAWEGENLALFGYDVHAQEVYAKKRKGNGTKETGQEPEQAAGQEPEQAAGQEPEQAAGQAAIQIGSDRIRAYRGKFSPGEDDPGEEIPSPGDTPPLVDDDSAPDAAGDIVERDYEEQSAPVTEYLATERQPQPVQRGVR